MGGLSPVKDTLYFAAEKAGAFKMSGYFMETDSLSFGELQEKGLRLPIIEIKGERTFTAIAAVPICLLRQALIWTR